jgi:hypothetical protein
MSVDPIGLWWTAGALGAEGVMVPVLVGPPAGAPGPQASQRRRLVSWLAWLRQAALQSHVEMESGPQALTEGLEAGRLAWIPCFSMTLLRLEKTMGSRLGVAPLPNGPAGSPSPFTSNRVWALGPDSSPEQRRMALQLAAISLDPLVQREMMMGGRVFLPANRFVPIPVTSSGRLAAMAIASRQYESSSSLLDHSFSMDVLQRRLPTVERALMDVMVGVTSPEQGAGALLRLNSPASSGR